MNFENGKYFPHIANEIRKLIGKKIKYLRNCDIDKSGRNYMFPRTGTITDVHGKNVEFDHVNWEYSPTIVEYEEIE